MTTDQLIELTKTFGVPLTALIIILWSGYTKKWNWTYVQTEALAARDAAQGAALAALKEAHAAALAERDAQIGVLRGEKDALWQFALRATGILDRTTEAASRGASAAAALARRKPADGA